MNVGCYPVYIGETERGKVRISREGLYTLIEADCAESPGIIRLYACGKSGCTRLGVLCPEDGRLRLKKRLSAFQLRSFPHDADSFGDEEYSRRRSADKKAHPTDISEKQAISAERLQPQKENDILQAQPVQMSMADKNGWYALPDGCLKREGYIALPCALRHRRSALKTEIIGGKEYIIFRY